MVPQTSQEKKKAGVVFPFSVVIMNDLFPNSPEKTLLIQICTWLVS